MRAVTNDLYEAAFLVCAGHGLAETWLDRGRHRAAVTFVFDGDDSLCAHQRCYRCGTATVNVADFRRQLNALRDQIRTVSAQHNKNATTQDTRRSPNHATTAAERR